MAEISNLINYFKDCYQADTRTLTLTNFFSQKVEHRFFIEGRDQLLNCELPYYPVDLEYVQRISSELSLYKREKEFYCAAFFVVGRQEDALRSQSKICAPLFLYPAKFETEGAYSFVKVEFEKMTININFLNSIRSQNEDDFYESIQKNIQPQMTDYGNVGRIRSLLESKIPDMNAEDIFHYPELFDEKRLKKVLAPNQLTKLNGYRLIPAVGFGLLRRSNTTQGIISELSLMAKQKTYAISLQSLFENEDGPMPRRLSSGTVPAILSRAQHEIINSVNKYRLTLVVGPPGTGKSFTIASLALDYLSKNKSVLIASKTDQAVDVVQKKILDDLKVRGVAFRAGKSSYKKELKEQLKNLLTNTRRRPSSKHVDIALLRMRLDSVKDELRDMERKFADRVRQELKWGRYVRVKWDSDNFLSKLKIRYIKWRDEMQVPHWKLTSEFLSLQVRYTDISRDFLQLKFQNDIDRELYKNRAMFKDFLKSVTARTSGRQDMLFEKINLKHLLKTFPIWLVNMADIYDIFPLEKEVFDLAIIDEATQCDIASCLPIIQRAKRIVIVGDPKQLRHASFLSQSVQRSLQLKNEINSEEPDLPLDYRNTSILDLVNDKIGNQKQVCFLDEHYRSKPDIIGFSNRNFYDSSLRIMTSIPYKDENSNQTIIEANGKRDENGVNSNEALLIIGLIKKLIREQQQLDQQLCQSIGVLSPFRDQVEYIGELIGKDISIQDIEKHNIRCGTAYSFQGEERDIMLLSFAIDENSHHSAIIHINKPDVFNVSVTRARSKQIVFTSFSDGFNCGIYLSKFIQEIRNFEREHKRYQCLEKDELLDEVKKRLTEQKLEYWQEYSVAGLELDLVFKRNEKYFGVDIIGYPGVYEDALSIDDHKILARAGVPTFPLPYTYWKFDDKKCFDELIKFSER